MENSVLEKNAQFRLTKSLGLSLLSRQDSTLELLPNFRQSRSHRYFLSEG